jgi:hypothetical protein
MVGAVMEVKSIKKTGVKREFAKYRKCSRKYRGMMLVPTTTTLSLSSCLVGCRSATADDNVAALLSWDSDAEKRGRIGVVLQEKQSVEGVCHASMSRVGAKKDTTSPACRSVWFLLPTYTTTVTVEQR